MAVSKTQNERPAIVALIDLANQLEVESNTHARNIETLTDGLADEVSDRDAADTLLEEAIRDEAEARAQAVQAEAQARAQAVQGVQNQIGEGVFSSSFTITQGFQQTAVTLDGISDDVDTLTTWNNRFRMGLTQSVTAPAGASASGTVGFETPFDSGAEVAVFLACVDSSATLTDLTCKVTTANYDGFEFDVLNSSQTSATVKVGFLAVRMN